jgi:hypothetical protein
MATPNSELVALTGRFPGAPTRGGFLDWASYRTRKLGQRIGWALGREKVQPHRRLLTGAVEQLRAAFGTLTCVETGCIRWASEGTESTLAIATALGETGGVLHTFELEPDHIAVCKSVCRDVNQRIRYWEGDSRAKLRKLHDDGTLGVVHLAFFDSGDDPDLIFDEFRAIEDLFVPGSIVVVDDTIPPSVKGRRIKPYLHRHEDWDTRVIFSTHGMLVARKRSPA